ncbi:Os10g0426700 [Oryza sativa Japonica Group]|uniref:Os10g0426700 protein n=2 Tax=Oryza sativa subsp. japonica TaxID=39947 RepID=Q0IXK6_ORYSJ|nr:Os10g0426700 [Oryza sativa Japonica Group]BAT10928.1 Os10g0426700 [Oryza sativa Japonica Group]|eukprot:NP_001064645.1 Os10g0426700 [Oryza sativa Japonica Group]
MATNSVIREGQLLLRCSKPSPAMAAFRFSGELRKSKHAFLRPSQWCCSASARTVATELTSMRSHSFSSHTSLSLSMAYLSAATSRCWHMAPSSFSFISGNESVYAKRSSALNTCASMSTTRTTAFLRLSFIEPSSSAPNTGDRAASTHR